MEASQPSSNPTTAQQKEEEINLCLRINKTVNFKISKNETVGRVKALLHGKEGIPECLQELFFYGNHLESDKRLVDYGISGDSVLNAYVGNSTRKLTIKLPSKKRSTITVEVRAQDTIKHVKALIEAKEKICSDQFSLVYGGKVLEEDKTLAFLGIKCESTLHMVSKPREILRVSVKKLSGETLKTQLRALSTVLDVKTLLESKVGYPVEVLAYEGKKLKDSKTLVHCNIKDGSVLEMLRPTIHIFIKGQVRGSFEQGLKSTWRTRLRVSRKRFLPSWMYRLMPRSSCLSEMSRMIPGIWQATEFETTAL